MNAMIFKSTIKDYSEKAIAENMTYALYELEQPITLTLNNGNKFQIECTHCYFNKMAGVPEFGYLEYNEECDCYQFARFSVRGYDETTGCCLQSEANIAREAYQKAVRKSYVSTDNLRTSAIYKGVTVYSPMI